MAINKVVFGEETLIDLTDTTATEQDVINGKSFYGKDGIKTLGTASGTSYKKLGETDISVNTTSTTNTNVGSINCGSEAYTKNKILYVRIRDKAGRRNGYCYGSDNYFINLNAGLDYTDTYSNASRFIHKTTSDGKYAIYMSASASCYGVYAYSISSQGVLTIYTRYNANNTLTINGTYHVEVYTLDFPDGVSPF